ncbi:MAG: heavy metal-binding domain-containing protein [Syntrophomonadaceae bacterium]
MKKSLRSAKLIKFCLAAAFVAFVYSGNVMAQSACSQKDHKMNMSVHDNMNMGPEKDNKTVTKDNAREQPVVYKGIIDLKAIDKNKDGKVFQDQMDWNVISDKPGACPLCKMTLEEVTLKQAKDNLEKNGFKIK